MTFVEMSGVNSLPHLKRPIVFEDFFELGLSEESSPFLTPESRKWGKNLALKGAILSAFLLLTAFILSFYPSLLPLSYFFTALVYFFVGIPSLIEALKDLGKLDVNIDVLMTFAAFASVFLGGALEGGLLLVLFAISGAMEEAVTDKARSSIGAIKKLSPSSAMVLLEDGRSLERSVKDIEKGTFLLIKAGQVIPLDGRIKEGFSSLDLSHLTGESAPVICKIGDIVPSGAQNLEGSIVIEVSETIGESTLAKIIQLVTEAEEAKPKLERFFDKFSKTYAIAIISLFAFFSLSLPYFLGIPFAGNEGSLYRALAFLIAASPCALIIALPTAYLSAISASAKKGILLKGGVKLDALASCNAVAFDKTGTLTSGKLVLKEIIPLQKNSKFQDLVLPVARALEQKAIHPIGKSIVEHAERKKTLPYKIQNFQAIAGSGLKASLEVQNNPCRAAIGSLVFIASQLDEVKKNFLLERAKEIEESGLILAVLKIEEELYLFTFEDEVREDTLNLVHELKKQFDLKLFMLTGDHYKSAEKIAKKSDIPDFFYDLKPEDKLRLIASLGNKYKMAMVGDGVNDAPALARANVGIGMGKIGSSAAIQAADIVLLQDNIGILGWLFAKAKKTKKIVAQNLTIAIGAIIFASLLSISGLIPLWLAVIFHEGGTVLVGLNALRLLKD